MYTSTILVKILGKVGDSLKYIFKRQEKEAEAMQVAEKNPFNLNRARRRIPYFTESKNNSF